MELRAGTYRYRTTVSMMGRERTIENRVMIKELPEGWSVVESFDTPQGQDSAVLAKGSLTLKSRAMATGPTRLDLSLTEGRISGIFLMMNGQTQEISAEIGGDLFAWGPGAAQSIAALPLSEGFSTTFRTFDVATRAVSIQQLAVAEASPETFRVEVTPGEWTLWIDRDSGNVTKVARAKGGMTMVSELIPQ